MERSTMFLHFLLVLLVAIQVTLACQCKPLTLGEAMCSSKTVVLARVSGGESTMVGSVPYTRYDIDVNEIFKAEENKVLTLDGIRGSLLFPQNVADCGQTLTDNEDYVIVGSVDSSGTLVSSRRFHIVPYGYIYSNEDTMSILRGKVECTNI